MHNFLVSILTFHITRRGNEVISCQQINSVKNRLKHILPIFAAVNLLAELCPVPITQTTLKRSSEINVPPDLFLIGSLAVVIIYIIERRL